jgi:hypothetical protein
MAWAVRLVQPLIDGMWQLCACAIFRAIFHAVQATSLVGRYNQVTKQAINLSSRASAFA